MKSLIVTILLLGWLGGYSQGNGGYATLGVQLYHSNNIQLGAGLTLSGGGILKQNGKPQDDGMYLGAGAGLFVFEQDGRPFMPIFLETGYIWKSKKIAPYINVRGGYSFYEGSSYFVGENEDVNGGFYGEFRGGCSFKVAKFMRITPFIALSLIQLRYGAMQKKQRFNKSLPTAGVAFLFAR